MKKSNILFLAVACLCLTQCKKDKPTPVNSYPEGLDALLIEGGGFNPVTIQETLSTPVIDEYSENGQRWRCTTVTHDVQDGIGGEDGFALFNPTAEVIYPGNLLQGTSLRQATPDVIAVKRAGGTISYDIIDGNLKSSFTVDEVKKSSVTDAMNNIIANATGTYGSDFNFSYVNIQSREQFAMEVKADYENSFLKLEGSLKLETDNSFNHYLIKLNQSFYTMSFDIPTNKNQLFDASVTAEDLAKYVGPGNPATYISSVTYGRIYYLLVESTSSINEMEAAISGSFNAIASGGSGSLNTSYLSSLNSLKIKMFAYGGDASGTLQTAGNMDLSVLASKLAAAGDIKSGKPLSYVVRSAYDNQIVSVQSAAKYDIKTCVKIGSLAQHASLSHWVDLLYLKSGNIGPFGPVGAITYHNPIWNNGMIYNKTGDLLVYDKNTITPRQLTGPTQQGSEPFANVGAIEEINGVLYAFNENGDKWKQWDNGNWSSIKGIGEFCGSNNPFNSSGITALLNFNGTTPLVINKAGTQYSFCLTIGGWQPAVDIKKWGSGQPFSQVGAATNMPIGANNYTIFFNLDGTEYAVFDPTTSIWSQAFKL